MMLKRLLTALLLALLSATFLAAGYAGATAETGYINWFGPSSPGVGYPDECASGNSVIADTADNRAYVAAQIWSDCSSSNSRPPGWLGAKADGYRDGSYCGTTGWYYSNVWTTSFDVGQVLCSNPAGSQTFFTGSNYRYWFNGAYWERVNHWSPDQNY